MQGYTLFDIPRKMRKTVVIEYLDNNGHVGQESTVNY